MKIENHGADHLDRTQLRPAQLEGSGSAAGSPGTGPSARDQAVVSDRARVLGKARAALAEVPEVRADRVGALRQQIQSGAYQTPYGQLARRLLPRFA